MDSAFFMAVSEPDGRGVFNMKHFMEQHVFHSALRHTRLIKAAVEQNLVGPGIVAAELPPPAAQAPRNLRPLKPS